MWSMLDEKNVVEGSSRFKKFWQGMLRVTHDFQGIPIDPYKYINLHFGKRHPG